MKARNALRRMARGVTAAGALVGAVLIAAGGCGGLRSCDHGHPEIDEIDVKYEDEIYETEYEGFGGFEYWDEDALERACSEYEAVYEQARDPDLRWAALSRTGFCRVEQGKEADAASMVMGEPLPDEERLRVRALLLRAELLTILMLAREATGDEITIDPGGEGWISGKTRGEVKGTIDESFEELWSKREVLAHIQVQDEPYLLDLGRVDRGGTPTLFDVLVSWWVHSVTFRDGGKRHFGIEDLMAIQEDKRIRHDWLEPSLGGQYLQEELDLPVDPHGDPMILSVALMNEASTFETSKRQEAAERWRVGRIVYVLQHFDFRNSRAAQRQAAKVLSTWSDRCVTEGGRIASVRAAADVLYGLKEYALALAFFRELQEYENLPEDQIDHRLSMLQTPEVVLWYGDEGMLVARNVESVHVALYRLGKLGPGEHDCKYRSVWWEHREAEKAEARLEGLEPVKVWDLVIDPDYTHEQVTKNLGFDDLEPSRYMLEITSETDYEKPDETDQWFEVWVSDCSAPVEPEEEADKEAP